MSGRIAVKRPIYKSEDGDWFVVPLTRGMHALIDGSDVSLVGPYNWSICGEFPNFCHARTCINHKFVAMHRLIMDPPHGMVVDHKNGQRLDNRRSNLRVCTQAQNTFNKARQKYSRSGFKGVSYTRAATDKCWVANIRKQGKLHRIACFASPEDAARAYDQKAIELFGEFARTNFPKEDA